MEQRDSCEPAPEKNDPVHEQRETREGANPSKEVTPSAVVVPPSPQGPQPPPNKDEARERRTERRDRMRLGVEILAVIVGLVGIGGLFVTFRETQETNRIARQTLEVQERPWITVSATLSSSFTFSEDGAADVGVRLLLENVGHSVATGIKYTVYVPLLSYESAVGVRDKVCEEYRRGRDVRGGEFVLFPEQRRTVDSWIRVGDSEYLQENASSDPRDPRKVISPVVVGCVTYESPSFPERRVTGFIYALVSKKYGASLPIGETLPLTDVYIYPYALASSYID